MPLSRFDALDEADRAEIIQYYRTVDAMAAYEQQRMEDEMRANIPRI